MGMHLTEARGPIKYAAVALSDSGDVVTLVAGKKIRVLSYCLNTTTAVTVKFQSGAATDLTGAMAAGATGRLEGSFNPAGHFETAAGAKLNIVLGSAVATNGHITYQEV